MPGRAHCPAAAGRANPARDIVELRVVPREDVVLVRPDGYIAWSGRARSDGDIAATVRTVLERQVH
jgi:hypothetical protein